MIVATVLLAAPAVSAAAGVSVRIKAVEFKAKTVIDDRRTAPPLSVNQFPACKLLDSFDWEDCYPGVPDGKPEKDWPIVARKGSALVIKEAVLRVSHAKKPLMNATVTGAATLPGGGALTFKATKVNQTGDVLVVKNLTGGNLPGHVTFLSDLAISWTVDAGGKAYDAGTSEHPIYVVYAAPGATALFETLVDFTTNAAAGESTATGVFDKVWQVFTTRDIHRVHLNTMSGNVTRLGGNKTLLRYYTEWTLFLELRRTYFDTCPPGQTTADILRILIGRCGGWARFFVDALGAQGVVVRDLAVDDFTGFPTGPAGADLMLINNWTFGAPSGAGDFPYVMRVRINRVGGRLSGSFVGRPDFTKGNGVAGQGAAVTPNPRGWFAVGDHAVDLFDGKIYDPSYGTGPFDDIEQWAAASLAGFAKISCAYNADGSGMCTIRAHRGIT
jgi:hypothetical protein